VSLADLDGDGDIDAYVVNGQANKVWLNDGAGNFTDNGQSLGSSNSYGISLADLDGDGDIDAFVANYNGQNKVWLNNTDLNLSFSATPANCDSTCDGTASVMLESSIFFNYSSFKITLPLVIYPYVLGPLFVFAFSIKTVTSYTTFSKYVDSLSILD